MNVKSKIIIAIISASFIISCVSSPSPVFKLVALSKDGNSSWDQGREYLNLRNDKLDVNISFVDIENELLVFDAIITNTSNKKLVIDHRILQLKYKTKESIYIEDDNSFTQSKLKTGRAVNPEAVILKIEKEINKTESAYESSQNTDTVISFLDLIGDIATIGTRTSEEKKKDTKEDNERMERNKESYQQYEEKLDKLKNKKSYWENNALRKTTLNPSETLTKKVYYKFTMDGIDSLTINIANEAESIEFLVISY